MEKGEQNPNNVLRNRFSEGDLHHGLIFQGNSIGCLEENALDLSRVILKMNQDSWEHPDLFHLRPAGKMRIISVEKTRELISDLSCTSNQGGGKVALIHEADRMRKESANAFLKTLEEPPPDTYLLLLTTRPNSMLPTIRSRCLTMRFKSKKQERNDQDWIDWKESYEQWILTLLDRVSLAKDRVTPIFSAYGLTSGLLRMIREKSEEECKIAVKSLESQLDEKEKDAFETGIRKSIRSQFLSELSDVTATIAIKAGRSSDKISLLSGKLARVIENLEKNTRLLEVNLKDEAAMEDFYLSSLRIWSAK